MRRLTARSPSGRPRISARPSRENQLHQQLEGGGLAGAVGPEEAEDFALRRPRASGVERAVRPLAPEPDVVVLGQLVGGERGHQRRSSGLAALAIRLQLVGDRQVEVLRRQAAFDPDAVDEERGRRLTPSCLPSAMSARTSSTWGVSRVEVGDLADVARRLPHRRRGHRRLVREEPLFHRLAALVLAAPAARPRPLRRPPDGCRGQRGVALGLSG